MEELRGFENPSQDKNENREQRADVLLRFLKTAENIEPLHGQKFEAVFSDEQHKREFIESLSAEEFAELLNGVNGILRNKAKEEWGMDGENVALDSVFWGTGYVPPRQEDKPELLAKTLSAAKEINQDNKSLEDIALLISSSLNAIHPYLDGNGRTSRLIYLLLTKDFNAETKNELQEVLSEHGMNIKVNIDPGLIQSEIDDLVEKEVGVENPEINKDNITNLFSGLAKKEIEFKQEISKEDKDLFLKFCQKDSDYLFWGVFEFLRDNPNFNNEEKCLKRLPDRTAILVNVLSKNLSQEQLSQILQNYRDLKKRYVEILINSIANPDDEEYQIDVGGQKIALKDYFESMLKEEQEKVAEENRIDRERQEAELQEKKRIEEKENAIKERFNNGEGNYKFFEASEINSLREAEQAISKIVEAEKVLEAESQEYLDEQKLDFLRESLFALVEKVNSQVSVSQEQISAYVENKKSELLAFFAQYHSVEKVMEYLENAGIFDYRINVSKDYEMPFLSQAYLDKQEDSSRFLDDLFSQSVYYVSPSGLSLRVKLFEIKSKKMDSVLQPVMEQIFYSDQMVDYIDKKVVKVSSYSPEQKKFVFEIATPEFRQQLSKQGGEQVSIKSGVGTISDEEDIYVNIPEGAMLHSGWLVVGVKELKD